MIGKGHWFIFVLYKPTGDGKRIEAKLVQYWSLSQTAAVKKATNTYPDYSQWFMVQTGWWKMIASLFSFGHIIKFK